MTDIENLRLEQLALLIGTIVGQISELLNGMVDKKSYTHAALLDIQKMAALQIHELYYKGNK